MTCPKDHDHGESPTEDKRPWPRHPDSAYIALHATGITCQEIACSLNVSTSTVRRVLKRVGVRPHFKKRKWAGNPPPPTPRKYPDSKYRALHDSGMGTGEIARRLGVSDQTVYRALSREGCTAPRVRVIPPELVGRARMLRAEGVPATWIAEDIGCSPHWVFGHTDAPPGGIAEWKSVWGDIRRRPDLLALHRQFAPR